MRRPPPSPGMLIPAELRLCGCSSLCSWKRRGASHRAPFWGAARPTPLLVPHAGERTLAVSRCFTWGLCRQPGIFFAKQMPSSRVPAAGRVLSGGKPPSPAQLLRVLQTRRLRSAGRRLPVKSGFCAGSSGGLAIRRHPRTQPSRLRPSKKAFLSPLFPGFQTPCSDQGYFFLNLIPLPAFSFSWPC